MSIASAITAAQQKVANAYTAVSNQGGTLPVTQDLSNLPTAIASIPSGGSDTGISRTVDSNHKYTTSSVTEFILPSDATDIDNNALYYAFYQAPSLTTIDLSSLTAVSGTDACNCAFYNCTSLTGALDLSSLVTISGVSGCYRTFYGCTGITSVDLSSLTTVGQSMSCNQMFYGCTNLASVDLSSLTTISGSTGCGGMFYGCRSLTSVTFSALTTMTVANNALNGAFRNCTSLTDLYFPALTTNSFGTLYKSQFTGMLQGVTGCKVHFPSNMSSKISTLTGYDKFSGTNTKCLFDLPATS